MVLDGLVCEKICNIVLNFFPSQIFLINVRIRFQNYI
jgi:hypothetical protein